MLIKNNDIINNLIPILILALLRVNMIVIGCKYTHIKNISSNDIDLNIPKDLYSLSFKFAKVIQITLTKEDL